MRTARRLLGAQIEAKLGATTACELPERARLELADALARDAELVADFLEGLRDLPVEAEAQLEHVAMRSFREVEGLLELDSARRARRARCAGCSEFSSSSMSPYIESPSPTGVSRLTGSSTRSKSSWTR